MKDKLIIQNFSGIDYLEIELKKLNILIGEQASGKSTVAKLFYYFNSLFEDLQTYIHQELFGKNNQNKTNSSDLKDLAGIQAGKFSHFFDIMSTNQHYQIEYVFVDNFSIRISSENDYIKIAYSDDLHQLLNEIIQKYQYQVINTENTFNSFELLNKISNSIQQDFENKGIHIKKQIFIPSGRSYFGILDENIYSEDNAVKNIDYLLKRFGNFYRFLKRLNKLELSNQHLFETIIKAKYITDDGEEFLVHSDERKVKIAQASSGQQEIFPILLIIQNILERNIKHNEGLILYIEEPEAHLFPTAQKDLVHLFARLFNHLQSDDCHIFITTHSPYLLSSFNTLLTAGSVVRQNPEKAQQVYQVIPENEVLFSEQVGAYSLMKGQLKSLIDPDEELILADVLDEVSGIIADEFDKLLDLKYGE